MYFYREFGKNEKDLYIYMYFFKCPTSFFTAAAVFERNNNSFGVDDNNC